MSEKKSVKDVLVEARELIAQPYQWRKGNWFSKKELPSGKFCWCYCALGAVRAVSGYGGPEVKGAYNDDTATTLYLRTEDHLDRTAKQHFGAYDTIHFNDATTTRKKDVLALFDKAIETVAA